MIVRKLDSLAGTEREVFAPNWKSTRLLLSKDKMGFSLHYTVIRAGTQTDMWYKNHLEAVLCVGGKGEILDKASQKHHPIEAGTMYALDQHDKHILKAFTDLKMVCVFNPPCVGTEVHDENGIYPLLEQREEVKSK